MYIKKSISDVNKLYKLFILIKILGLIYLLIINLTFFNIKD